VSSTRKLLHNDDPSTNTMLLYIKVEKATVTNAVFYIFI